MLNKFYTFYNIEILMHGMHGELTSKIELSIIAPKKWHMWNIKSCFVHRAKIHVSLEGLFFWNHTYFLRKPIFHVYKYVST